LVSHPVGCPLHIVFAAGVGADTGNPEEIAKFFLEA
jgi:hypothetical protein